MTMLISVVITLLITSVFLLSQKYCQLSFDVCNKFKFSLPFMLTKRQVKKSHNFRHLERMHVLRKLYSQDERNAFGGL